jgi:hypothetical protein
MQDLVMVALFLSISHIIPISSLSCYTHLLFCSILGFNCGEAVNFATGDWFPMGALASQRYALLNKIPIIPYEELLCNEAMLLFKSLKKENSSTSFEDLASQRSVKFSFVRLIRLHKQALQCLKPSSTSPTQEPIGCCLCKRDCYLAYIMCNCCCSDPICLFHGMEILLDFNFIEKCTFL